MILVAGVLVLLFIVAVAFVVRTQSSRLTASAQKEASLNRSDVDRVSHSVSQEVSGALFVRKLKPSLSMINNPDWTLWPRLPFNDTQLRYEIDDFTWDFDGPMGPDPQRKFNHARHDVTPSTNWPDWPSAEAWPDDQPGDPGIGDTRWLRDLEPLRHATVFAAGGDGINRELDAFSHYRHLTNLSRPDNAWRIVKDISDITGERTQALWDDGDDTTYPGTAGTAWLDGGIHTNLRIPIEQWTAQQPLGPATFAGNFYDPFYGNVRFPIQSPSDEVGFEDFNLRWMQWERFSIPTDPSSSGYDTVILNNLAAQIPPNFYDLSDLVDWDDNGDGANDISGFGERISDAYVGPGDEDQDGNVWPYGTPRWNVQRRLDDSDGDGFTDAFWHISPFDDDPDTRTIISFSITDNSGRLNANVGSRFIRSDIDSMQGGNDDFADRTRGWTPADLALIGQNFGDGSNKTVGAPETHANWNVGFLDADANRPGQAEQHDGFHFAEPWVKYGPRGSDGTWYPTIDSEILVDWLPGQWKKGIDTAQTSILRERNVRRNAFFPRPYDFGSDQGAAHDTHLSDNRLYWWQHAGLRPLDPDQTFQNFGLASELELRYHEGQNHPWLTSRFEHAVSPLRHTYSIDGQRRWGSPLRTGKKGNPTYALPDGHYWNAGATGFAIFREEASELGDQLSNRQLVFDNRRKLTLFNGARNETAPPWLWWDARVRDIDGSGNLIFCPGWSASVPPWELDTDQSMNWRCVELEFAEPFFAQYRQKIDLRGFENPNSPDLQERLEWYQTWASMNHAGTNSSVEPRRVLHERLPDALFLALTSGQMDPDGGNGNRDSFFGDDPSDVERTRDMAAALAANMLAYSDFDGDAPLHTQIADEDMRAETVGTPFPARTEFGAIAKPDLAGDSITNPNERFLGIEAQPFFTEAFIAHIYEPWEIPESSDWKYSNSGDHMFIDPDAWDTSVDNLTWSGLEVDEAKTFLKNAKPADPKTIIVVQIANPFDRPIPLFVTDPATGWAVPDPDGSGRRIPLYSISLWGQNVELGDGLVTLDIDQKLPDYLPPATDERPYTLTLYAVDSSIEQDWLDFLDIEAKWQPGDNRAARKEDQIYGDKIFRQDGSQLVIENGDLVANVASAWSIERKFYDANTGMNTQSLQLYRRHYRNWGNWPNDSEVFLDDWGEVTMWDYDEWVLIDRAAVGAVTDVFKIAIRDMASPWDRPPLLTDIRPAISKPMKIGGLNPGLIRFDTVIEYPDGPDDDLKKDTVDWTLPESDSDWGTRFGGGTNVRLAQWVRFTRAWGVDPQFNGHGLNSWPEYNLNERNPRYIFTDADIWQSWYQDEDWDDEHGPNAFRIGSDYEQVSDDGDAWDFDDDGTYDLLIRELDEDDPGVLVGTEFDRDDRKFRSWFNFKNALYNPTVKPDGTPMAMGPTDPNRLPWFTFNHKLPSTWLDDTDGDGDGQLDEWLVYRNRKPTFFDLNRDGDPRTLQEFVADSPSDAPFARYAFPDKGYYPTSLDFPLQLLQKDASFEQIGELNNVWLFGHEITVGSSGGVPVYTGTTTTFSEYMTRYADEGIYVNRLGQTVDNEPYGNIIGDTVTIGAIPEPAMPAGLRLFDLFVCDGPGLVDHMDVNNAAFSDGIPDSIDQMAYWYSENQDFIPSFGNAANFSEDSTPGLININTATPEVMRALPHMYKMVHADPGRNGVDGDYWGWLDFHDGDTFDFNLRVAIPEAIVQYREMQGHADDRTGYEDGPDYHQRDGDHTGLRTGRGMQAIGEVLMLQEPASGEYGNAPEPQGMYVSPQAWTAEFAVGGRGDAGGFRGNPFGQTPLGVANGGGGASEDPRHWDDHDDFNGLSLDLNDYGGGPPIGAYLSTDVVEGVPWYNLSTVHQRRAPRYGDWPDAMGIDDPLRRQYELSGDRVAGDSEEAGLLFAGISNLITTRSDVFTVHMHVRKVRRDSITGYFDGTDKASIIEDTRYVMLVDRSHVDVPSDTPVIRYMQKVPQ